MFFLFFFFSYPASQPTIEEAGLALLMRVRVRVSVYPFLRKEGTFWPLFFTCLSVLSVRLCGGRETEGEG